MKSPRPARKFVAALLALPIAALAQTGFTHPPVGGPHGMPGQPTTPQASDFKMPLDYVRPRQTTPAATTPRLTPDLVPLTPQPAPVLPNAGTVVSTVMASGYSYVEVAGPQGNLWLAGPAVELKAGDRIRYDTGNVMRNFSSRSLGRTFAEIIFVNRIVVDAAK